MKKLITFVFVLLNISMLIAQDITIEPQSVSADLIYGTTETQTITITNNGTAAIDFSVEGVKTKVLAITNSVDENVEYNRTINALNVFYDNYVLSEISTQEASELETALIGQNVLLVVQQEDCNVPTFASFAPVMQTFVENGGTVIFTGTSRTNSVFDGQCIFATDLFSGNYVASIGVNTDLSLSISDDFLVDGVSDPYEEEILTHYHDITNEDAVRVVEYDNADVVVYRNVGQGKVISIGHSFLNVNNDLRRILANAVKSGGGADWLNLSALDGNIPAGGTFTIDVTFDAGAVFGGLYELDLIIGDDTNEAMLPVMLNVTGIASFASSPTSINFGEYLTGSTVTEMLDINNLGTDSLFITNIESDNPDFTVNFTEAALYGGTSVELAVTYMPLAIETDNGALSIYTNVSANPFIIPLTGQGIGAPAITPNPESLEITLTEGEVVTENVTITNTGLGTLDFTVELGQGTGSGDVLVFADPNWSINVYNNIMDIITSTLSDDVVITQTYTTDATEMQTLLQQHGVLLLPFNDFVIQAFLNNNPTLVSDFMDNGGNVLFINNINVATATGVFEGFLNFGAGGTYEILEEHPITEGLPLSDPLLEFADVVEFQNDVTSLIEYTDGFATGSLAALNDNGDGLGVFLSLDFFNINSINEGLLSNSIQFLFDNATPDWLTFSPDSFTGINFPDGTANIDININSEGLLGGTYYAEIVLLNNSAIPEFIIPVTLVVIGVPQMVLETTDLDFGNVVIGNQPVQTIVIDNPGTDTLFVTNIGIDSDGYELSATSLTIPPLSSDELSITFTPTMAQDYGTTITLENNVENASISIAAIGMNAPSADISTANVSTTLLAGETSTESFMLNNLGAGILEYQVLATESTLEIAAWTYNINTFNYDNLQNTLPNILTDYNITEYGGIIPGELEVLLQGKSILLIPSWNFGGSTAIYENMSSTLQTFAENGGTIIVLGNSCLDCMNSSGLFTSNDYSFVGGTLNMEEDNHPLANGLEEPLNTTGFDWIVQDLQTGNNILGVITFFPDAGVFNYQNVGSGKVIYLSYSYGSTTNDPLADQLLGNAFAWGGLLPDWLSISNIDAPINPGESFEIELIYDATGLLAGTYTYDLVLFTNDPENPSITVTVEMTVEAFPQAAFSGNLLICDGYGYFNDATLNDPTSWNWNFGDGNNSEEQNPTHFFEDNGTYTVTLEACNDLGCNETTQTVEVNFAMMFCDTISLPATGNATLNSCNGVLQDAGGNGQYPNNMNSFTTIAPQGASQITLTFTSFSYEAGYDYISIYEGEDISGELLGFYEGDQLPNGDGILTFETGVITIEQHSDGSVQYDGFEATWECIAISDVPDVNFSDNVLDECTGLVAFTDISNNFPDAWTWDFGDGGVSEEQFPQHNYASSGTYSVTLEACNFIGCQSFTQDITVENVLSVEFSLPDAAIGIPAQYINTTDDAASCTWIWGDGSPNSSGTCTPLHVYTTAGTYTITLEVTDGDGCTRSASQDINVYPVGMNDVAANTSLNLYPNPASDLVQLNYAFEGQQQLEIQILDAVGRVVKSEKATALNGYQKQLNFANQPKGYYIVSITSENGTIKKELLIQ